MKVLIYVTGMMRMGTEIYSHLLTKERWMDAAYANSTETAKKWNVRFGFG
jgi:hypothetical protein